MGLCQGEGLSMLGFFLRRLSEKIKKSVVRNCFYVYWPGKGFWSGIFNIYPIYSTSLVKNKRLRIDIGVIKETVKTKVVKSVSWCPGSIQITNPLTQNWSPSNLLKTSWNQEKSILMDGIYDNFCFNHYCSKSSFL